MNDGFPELLSPKKMCWRFTPRLNGESQVFRAACRFALRQNFRNIADGIIGDFRLAVQPGYTGNYGHQEVGLNNYVTYFDY